MHFGSCRWGRFRYRRRHIIRAEHITDGRGGAYAHAVLLALSLPPLAPSGRLECWKLYQTAGCPDWDCGGADPLRLVLHLAPVLDNARGKGGTGRMIMGSTAALHNPDRGTSSMTCLLIPLWSTAFVTFEFHGAGKGLLRRVWHSIADKTYHR